MIILLGAFTIGHVLFYLILFLKWRRIPLWDEKDRHLRFSVVIPARNEGRNITRILTDLSNQDYPSDLYEVIVVDDFSTDDTLSEVEGLIKNSEFDLQIISLEHPDKKGKKQALTHGIEKAKYEVILTTDADCRLSESWIRSYDRAFSENTQIVAGIVSLTGNSIFGEMQKTEFAGLVAFGGVTLTSDNPSMCSGANLGFRKAAFEKVGGYKNNFDIPSGDDEFLLYDIMQEYPGSGRFLKSQKAIVQTGAHTSFRAFINQRSRWVSKWRYNKNVRLRFTAVLFFIDYSIFVAGLTLGLMGKIPFWLFMSFFGIRFAANYLLLKPLSDSLNQRNVFIPLFLLQIFYPFHVLFMGVVSIFGGYTWKGRKY